VGNTAPRVRTPLFLGGIINKEDPEPYREYFNDGDTLEEVIKTEISYITKDIIQYAKNK